MNFPEIRNNKKKRILALFSDNMGIKWPTAKMHEVFGTAFRSRVSEINRDNTCPIVILNETTVQGRAESSVYWSEYRAAVAEQTVKSF